MKRMITPVVDIPRQNVRRKLDKIDPSWDMRRPYWNHADTDRFNAPARAYHEARLFLLKALESKP